MAVGARAVAASASATPAALQSSANADTSTHRTSSLLHFRLSSRPIIFVRPLLHPPPPLIPAAALFPSASSSLSITPRLTLRGLPRRRCPSAWRCCFCQPGLDGGGPCPPPAAILCSPLPLLPSSVFALQHAQIAASDALPYVCRCQATRQLPRLTRCAAFALCDRRRGCISSTAPRSGVHVLPRALDPREALPILRIPAPHALSFFSDHPTTK